MKLHKARLGETNLDQNPQVSGATSQIIDMTTKTTLILLEKDT
ncbi:hypothetical protein [Nostoc sp.]